MLSTILKPIYKFEQSNFFGFDNYKIKIFDLDKNYYKIHLQLGLEPNCIDFNLTLAKSELTKTLKNNTNKKHFLIFSYLMINFGSNICEKYYFKGIEQTENYYGATKLIL